MRMGIGCWQSGDRKAAMLALVPAKQGAAQERGGSQDLVCRWTGLIPPKNVSVIHRIHNHPRVCFGGRPKERNAE